VLHSDLEIDRVEAAERMPDASRYWEALLPRGAASSIFQTREWLEIWAQIFGPTRGFWNLGVSRGGNIAAFAPLMCQQLRSGHRELQLAAGTHCDYGDFLYRGAPGPALTAIGRELAASANRWDSFYVRNVPADSPTCAALPQSMRAAGLYCLHESVVSAPALLLGAGRGEKVLDRYSLRRPLQRLQRAGTVRFRTIEEPREIASALPRFFEQHQARWSGTATPSAFADPQYRRWFEVLAAEFAPLGWLHFSVLELDAEPVAFHFGFRYGQKLVWYKPSYSREHSRLSPGVVLITHLVRAGIALGLEELDFTIGNEPFKQRFANVERWNSNFRIYHDRHRYCVALAGSVARSAYKRGRRALLGLLPGRGEGGPAALAA
jgi:CelD/BcsL family acetyltransferase involved in cellulose biosynthesis